MNLSAERLRELFYYDPDTGIFTRRVSVSGGAKAGDIAGNDDGAGYLRVGIDGAEYRCHVLAWLYMMGEPPAGVVDHINQTKSDNRWANLRQATRRQNLCNVKINAANTTGYRGVSRSGEGAWVAQIKVNYRRIYLGSFRDPVSAAKARDAAAIKYQGEFARLNFSET